jgi:hypothetical protein
LFGPGPPAAAPPTAGAAEAASEDRRQGASFSGHTLHNCGQFVGRTLI